MQPVKIQWAQSRNKVDGVSAEVKMSLNLLLAAEGLTPFMIEIHHGMHHGMVETLQQTCRAGCASEGHFIPFHVANIMMDTSPRIATAKEGLLELS